MKLFARTAFAAALLGSASFAGSIAPSDVQFGESGEVQASLTGIAGDAANGRKLFMNRKKGNCLACHVNTEMSEQSFHGEVGPELDGMLVNSKMMFEGTIMPAFYKDAGYNRTLKKFVGKTILEAQEVEDILAYLLTLKE